MNHHSDIAIIGCGPAGAVAGALLAAKGYSVVIFDRDQHPRHHIGESLLPASMSILASIGIDAAHMQKYHQGKYGARFFDPMSDRLEVFGFARPEDGAAPPTFNVLREDFDLQLRDAAAQAGCVVYEHCHITAVAEDQSPVQLQTASGLTHTCDFVMDASGGAALLAKKQRHREMIPDFGRLAIYNYFADMPAPQSSDPYERQYLTMHLIDGGWIWFIPLRNGSTSVGAVLRREMIQKNLPTQEQFFTATAHSPRLHARLLAATPLAPYRAAADYSYHCGQTFGRRHLLIGDAAGFLDPIFSSGVHLAMASAVRAAEAVDALLRRQDDMALPAYQAHMQAGMAVFRAFVERFYQRDLVRNLFFAADRNPAMRNAIINILAGNVWDMSNPLICMLHKSVAAGSQSSNTAGTDSLDGAASAISTTVERGGISAS
jgi:flavin-dependent dehydrogenase